MGLRLLADLITTLSFLSSFSLTPTEVAIPSAFSASARALAAGANCFSPSGENSILIPTSNCAMRKPVAGNPFQLHDFLVVLVRHKLESLRCEWLDRLNDHQLPLARERSRSQLLFNFNSGETIGLGLGLEAFRFLSKSRDALVRS